MSREWKNLVAVVFVLVTFVTVSVPALAAGPAGGGREGDPQVSWTVRILGWRGWLGWLGIPPSLGSVWEASSAYIDPNGQPLTSGGETGASAYTDDSAHIDPNG